VEALDRQEPFINQTLAVSSLAMLARLLRYGQISYHGGFYNAETGRLAPIQVDPIQFAKMREIETIGHNGEPIVPIHSGHDMVPHSGRTVPRQPVRLPPVLNLFQGSAGGIVGHHIVAVTMRRAAKKRPENGAARGKTAAA
jgi:hypothetical protein